jgi:hypothetical protein
MKKGASAGAAIDVDLAHVMSMAVIHLENVVEIDIAHVVVENVVQADVESHVLRSENVVRRDVVDPALARALALALDLNHQICL